MTEEIKKEVALFFYNAKYPEAYSEKELQEYIKKVEQIVGIIDRAIQAERERIVVEVGKMKCEVPERGEFNPLDMESMNNTLLHVGRTNYNKALEDSINLINNK